MSSHHRGILVKFSASVAASIDLLYYRAKRRALRRTEADEITRAARANDRVKWRRVVPAVPPAGRPNVIVYCGRTTAWFIMRAGHIHVWNSGIIPLICGDHCSHRHSAKGIFSLFIFAVVLFALFRIIVSFASFRWFPFFARRFAKRV